MSWKVISLLVALWLPFGCGTEVIDLWPEAAGDAVAVDLRADAGESDIAVEPDTTAPPATDLSTDRGSISPTGQQP